MTDQKPNSVEIVTWSKTWAHIFIQTYIHRLDLKCKKHVQGTLNSMESPIKHTNRYL